MGVAKAVVAAAAVAVRYHSAVTIGTARDTW